MPNRVARRRPSAPRGGARAAPRGLASPAASALPQIAPGAPLAFDVLEFLSTAGASRSIVQYGRGRVIFHQGDPADAVLFIQTGTVKLSVVSDRGKEAVVAVLGAGSFFGEGALTGAPRRLGHATALEPCSVLVIDKKEMTRRLSREPSLAARFMSHLLARNVRIEADLVDQLFNSSERRLARALLLLARYGTEDAPHRTLPRVSQELLAEMVGTTRSRVNFFMNKFRRLGFVEYNGDIRVHSSLLNVVLHEDLPRRLPQPQASGPATAAARAGRAQANPARRSR